MSLPASDIANGISSLLPAAAAKPAGGAAWDQIAIANAMAIAATSVLAWLTLGHRSGRHDYLERMGAATERISGIPGWAALPSFVSTISLMVALFGMYWDISLHIGQGRDPGPLANPAHYFILVGLFGIFSAGWLAMSMPKGSKRPTPTAVRIGSDWYAPLGGILICACGFFALLGFPLDDMWHRLFGQDVTLWGPTHLMLIGGASLTLIGQAVLLVEGMRASGTTEREEKHGEKPAAVVRIRRMGIMGGFLIGLSTFQGEFDFGVPQFQMIFHPILLGLAAGLALVCARLWIGAGGAFGAALFFCAIRGIICLLVGPILGEATPHLPLYLAEAACVEAAAIFLVRRPFALATVSGVLIGTVGFAAEYGWSQIWMPIHWNTALLPSGPILMTIAGVAGGLTGALIALALQGRMPRPQIARAVAVGALVAVAALIADGLITTPPSNMSATVTLSDQAAKGPKTAMATIRLNPPDAAKDAHWFDVTSWQGGGLQLTHLNQVGPGTYRTAEPIPISGQWKSLVRLHKGRTLGGVPIYMPADPAIPVPAVKASRHFTRPFEVDKQILQRETKKGVPGVLKVIAPLVVLAIALGLLTLLAHGLSRVGRTGGRDEPPRRAGARKAGRQPQIA
jgi:hypothetical protein